jgi:hypothetical protein
MNEVPPVPDDRYLTREELYDRAAMRCLDEAARKKGKRL